MIDRKRFRDICGKSKCKHNTTFQNEQTETGIHYDAMPITQQLKLRETRETDERMHDSFEYEEFSSNIVNLNGMKFMRHNRNEPPETNCIIDGLRLNAPGNVNGNHAIMAL